ncbi:hypothetical protein SLEP1_g18334 [Rubroshorea leprosula]|uniref:Uncharacterized protein n=1 Tax=Rubroshorea leprosula TaxID=152421 RepID=A0AAV5J610_9ROSI|nr:hypothetical protein SLEP1_g18334 [Rubroshorea leprosula]
MVGLVEACRHVVLKQIPCIVLISFCMDKNFASWILVLPVYICEDQTLEDASVHSVLLVTEPTPALSYLQQRIDIGATNFYTEVAASFQEYSCTREGIFRRHGMLRMNRVAKLIKAVENQKHPVAPKLI